MDKEEQKRLFETIRANYHVSPASHSAAVASVVDSAVHRHLTEEQRIDAAKEQYDINRAFLQLETLLKYTSIENKKVFEVGAGFGLLAVLSRYFGFEYLGIEYDEKTHQVAQKILLDNNLSPELNILGDGCRTRFPDNTFDLIVSVNALEHTSNVSGMLHEALRIVKPDGEIIFSFPNYNSYFDSHSGVFWIPFVSNSFPSLYRKIFGVPESLRSALILQENFITYSEVKHLTDRMQRMLGNFDIIGWGKELFEERMNNPETFRCWETASLRKLQHAIRLAERSGLKKLLAKLIATTNTYTPIVLHLRKKAI